MSECFWKNLKGVFCRSEPAADLVGNTPDNPILYTGDMQLNDLYAFDANDQLRQSYTFSYDGTTRYAQYSIWYTWYNNGIDCPVDNQGMFLEFGTLENGVDFNVYGTCAIHSTSDLYGELGIEEFAVQRSNNHPQIGGTGGGGFVFGDYLKPSGYPIGDYLIRFCVYAIVPQAPATEVPLIIPVSIYNADCY